MDVTNDDPINGNSRSVADDGLLNCNSFARTASKMSAVDVLLSQISVSNGEAEGFCRRLLGLSFLIEDLCCCTIKLSAPQWRLDDCLFAPRSPRYSRLLFRRFGRYESSTRFIDGEVNGWMREMLSHSECLFQSSHFTEWFRGGFKEPSPVFTVLGC
jgi:hypothetical protein